MLVKLPNQIREFLSAVGNPYSYNFMENIYIWFGLLWGLPIPLVTIAIQTISLSQAGVEVPLNKVLQSPVQWFFMLHPIMFGTLFGILGTIRFEKERELTGYIDQLKDLTIHDSLTGLKNRRHFSHSFHDECARSLRRGEPLALLFIDIDHFKQINDTHGHYIGDQVLKELGAFLKSHCRPYDTPVRWGGEEFLVLLRATDEPAAITYAERIRVQVETDLSPKPGIRLTVSIGLAEHDFNDTLDELTNRADQALYYAKQNGRNQVVAWSQLQANTQP